MKSQFLMNRLNSFFVKCCICILCLYSTTPLFSQTAFTGMRGISPMQATAEMAPGINLYNTLDAAAPASVGLGSETYWGQPKTKKEMITSMADRGFNTLRLPVTWYNHTGSASDYTIKTEWLDRVEEVANYAFDNNMYVIINMHHEDLHEGRDGSWLCPTYEKQDALTDQIAKMWAQIATRFKEYGDYLVFETMNEPRQVGGPNEWSGGTDEHREVVNALNLAAVNAIRATGGNNATRFIMTPQVGGNTGAAIDALVFPNDDPNIIVSVHNYFPYHFCQNSSGTSKWGSASDVAALENMINSVGDHFVKNGRAVVMGEWGAIDKDNLIERMTHYDAYTRICKEAGITPMIWMFAFNRNTLTWPTPLLEEAILHHYDSTTVYVDDIILNTTTDTLQAGETLQLTATVLPENATYQDVAWTSYNKNVASVSSTGLVEAKASGKATIKAGSIGQTTEFQLVVIDTVMDLNHRIEAEDYASQSGIQSENTSDAGGGQNIGYIQNGDWCKYDIQIDSSGIYDFVVRAATETNGGTIEIKLNNKVIGETAVEGSKSNGWQDWYTTAPVELELGKGSYDLKLTFKGSSGYLFNLNWFEMNYNRPFAAAVQDNDFVVNDFRLNQNYPNPFNHSTIISYNLPKTGQVDLSVYNFLGQKIATLVHSEQTRGAYSVSWDAAEFASGVYYYKISSGEICEMKKMILIK